jgi:hypothetical protein
MRKDRPPKRELHHEAAAITTPMMYKQAVTLLEQSKTERNAVMFDVRLLPGSFSLEPDNNEQEK